MIGIATTTFDITGARIFRDSDRAVEQANRGGERRVSRTATLDGGVVVTDGGFSDGDRTLVVTEPDASLESIEFARYITETYAEVWIATEDGAYLAAPESYRVQYGTLTWTFLVAEKLSG